MEAVKKNRSLSCAFPSFFSILFLKNILGVYRGWPWPYLWWPSRCPSRGAGPPRRGPRPGSRGGGPGYRRTPCACGQRAAPSGPRPCAQQSDKLPTCPAAARRRALQRHALTDAATVWTHSHLDGLHPLAQGVERLGDADELRLVVHGLGVRAEDALEEAGQRDLDATLVAVTHAAVNVLQEAEQGLLARLPLGLLRLLALLLQFLRDDIGSVSVATGISWEINSYIVFLLS